MKYKLGDIVSEIIDYRGKTPKKLGFDWSDSGIKALSAKNIKTGQIVQPETIRYVAEENYPKWMKQEVERGTILVTSEAPFGQIFYWDSDEKIVLSQRLFAVKIKKEFDSKFVYYQMISEKFQNELSARATGSTVTGLRQPELMKCELDLPDLETQQKIVRILSALDSKIENNNEICANLEKQAEVLFKNWFIDFEPFKNDELVETGLGMIPKEWKIMPLGKIFDFRRGTALTKNDVSVKRDKDHPFVVYGAGRDVFGYSERYTINTPSVLIAAIGAGAGTVSRSYERRYSVTSNAFYVLPKNEFDYPYEIFSLRNYNFKDRCSGSAQPMLSYGAFSEDACVCPSANALKKFYDICSPMIKKIDKLMEQNNTLSSIRDALLPKLMNGEINLEN